MTQETSSGKVEKEPDYQETQVDFDVSTMQISYSFSATKAALPTQIDLMQGNELPGEISHSGIFPKPEESILRWYFESTNRSEPISNSKEVNVFEKWSNGRVFGTDCLFRFIKLSDASDEEIRRFAQLYGPLEICQHGVPKYHDSGCQALYTLNQDTGPLRWYWEPIALWRLIADQLKAILQVGSDLRIDGVGKAEYWKRFVDGLVFDAQHRALYHKIQAGQLGDFKTKLEQRLAHDERLDVCSGDIIFQGIHHRLWREYLDLWLEFVDQRSLFADHITFAMKSAGLQPAMQWPASPTGGLPRISFAVLDFASYSGVPQLVTPAHLYPTLICQLVSVVSSNRWVVACHKCGQLYQPKRRPWGDRPRYCYSLSCQREPNKNYARKQRAKAQGKHD